MDISLRNASVSFARRFFSSSFSSSPSPRCCSCLLPLLAVPQMYVDGYTPNFYWRYSLPYGPSCSDVVSWIKENPGIIAKMRPPVSSAPPLPAAVACLCMMPMTKDGRDFLPKRLQPLVEPGSPLREALEWTGVKAGLDIPKVLRVMQQEAPLELVKFRDGTHNRLGERARIFYRIISNASAVCPILHRAVQASGRLFAFP